MNDGMDTRWGWRSILQRSAEVLQNEGALSLWFRILGELGYRRMILSERPLDQPPCDVQSRIRLTVSLLTLNQVNEYTASIPAPTQRGFKADSNADIFASPRDIRAPLRMWVG